MRTHLSYANVMATIAVFIALGGSSYAAVTLSKNSVRAKHIKNGEVKRADLGRNAVDSSKVKDGSLRAQDFGAAQLPAGPQGRPGPQGAAGAPGSGGAKGDKGDPGDPATRLWAAVEGGMIPVILRGHGATAVERLGGGQYRVTFDRDIRGCAWLASPGDPSVEGGWGAQPPTTARASFFGGDARAQQVVVETWNVGGANENHGFFLAVFC